MSHTTLAPLSASVCQAVQQAWFAALSTAELPHKGPQRITNVGDYWHFATTAPGLGYMTVTLWGNSRDGVPGALVAAAKLLSELALAPADRRPDLEARLKSQAMDVLSLVPAHLRQ
jgi:hypothetical protein